MKEFNQYLNFFENMQGQNNNNVNDQQPRRVTISTSAFAAKYRSKREVFNFLAVDANVYLPSYGKCLTRWSIRISGHRRL